MSEQELKNLQVYIGKRNQNQTDEQEIGKSTVNVSRTEKDKAKERYQRNMQERKIEGQEQDY